jgi:serine/threonine protein kinase
MNQENLCYGCMREKGPAQGCSHCGWAENSNADSTLYLTPGTVLSNKYLVGKVLGQGGFGITYLGWDRNLDIRVAIKEYFPQGLVSRVPGENNVHSYTGQPKDQFSFGLDSFLREAKILARFEHHPNIVTVRDFFRDNNTAYMVMSFIEGVTLLDYLKSKGERIPVDRAIEIMMPVLDALKGVHSAGIMHRDISPDNIFIDHEGRVILIDFGAARQEMREKSKSLSVILKAGYAPEEQYRSRGKQGPWTDIYAVAATMYRCITGQVPPEAMDRLAEDDLIPPSKSGVSIGSTYEKALLKALSVRAEGRFQTVEDFQAALLSSAAFKEAAIPVKENEINIFPSVIKRPVVNYDADYYIDYTGGTIPLGELPIGARVVDPTWRWEFKKGDKYTGTGELKPLAWLVVAKDHYDIKEPHVTLLAEELIGRHFFDNSKGWFGLISGKNHWGASSTGNATRGLRPWLNSNGIHAGEGFYLAFSKSFENSLLITILPNKEWKNGNAYSTQDRVFLPSTTELGDTVHRYTHKIGTAYPFFQGAENAKRVALLNGKAWWYWARSPDSYYGTRVSIVFHTGEFYSGIIVGGVALYAVRPALNLKADTLVSEIR